MHKRVSEILKSLKLVTCIILKQQEWIKFRLVFLYRGKYDSQSKVYSKARRANM